VAYTPLFNPDAPDAQVSPDLPVPEGDRAVRPVYVYTDPIKLAVNVALATGRPLLLRGDPGSGKSSLARHVAGRLGWRYYEAVITSRTRAQDLQWQFDALRRLQDAQVKDKDLSPVRYINPGVLWWALHPASARYRGVDEATYPADLKPLADPAAPTVHERAVVLLDEIDKADPDVPNNLLDVLGSRHFKVEDLQDVAGARADVSGPPSLIFITTNGERELPEAFLRRCVVLTLKGHEKPMLAIIARAHFPAEKYPRITDALLEAVYGRLQSLGDEAGRRKLRGPSTAEFLDTLRACDALNIDENDPDWRAITRATLWKAKIRLKEEASDGAEDAS